MGNERRCEVSDTQSVKDKLAEVRCEAAPHGWSVIDSHQGMITQVLILDNGIIMGESGDCAMFWEPDGKENRKLGDLVPLPAPKLETPEQSSRISSEEIDELLGYVKPHTDVGKSLMECRDSRREIAELRAEVDRITKDARYWKENQLRVAVRVDRLTRELGEWKELAHSQQRAFGELLGERNAAVERFQSVSEDHAAVARERDEAIELAYCRAAGPGVKAIPWKEIARIEKGRGDNLAKNLEAISGRDSVACDPREFPFDRPGWFYKGDVNDSISFTIGSHVINDYIEIGTGWWIHIDDLRTGVRSASPAGPWEQCPKGGDA